MPVVPKIARVPTANQKGVCPHCGIGVRFEVPGLVIEKSNFKIGMFSIHTPENHRVEISACCCPECGKPIFSLGRYTLPNGTTENIHVIAYPDAVDRPVPQEVQSEAPEVATDFREAVAVFPKSKQASAALSRRCLQLILTTKGGAKTRDLADQIEEVLPKLPTELAENVDAIRHIGNFAAHPIKSKSTGEIVKVEDGEAEWLLDVLEDLLEYYYVAPARAAARRAALNQKLSDLGKPLMKAPKP